MVYGMSLGIKFRPEFRCGRPGMTTQLEGVLTQHKDGVKAE